jgi:hypothetical protein
MNNLDTIKYILENNVEISQEKLDLIKHLTGEKVHKRDSNSMPSTFLEIGKQYIIRSITMIYTGRVMDIRDNEVLLEDAAWIAETARWTNSLTKCEFNEVEPYPNPVVLHRSTFLDYTEIDTLPREQK